MNCSLNSTEKIIVITPVYEDLEAFNKLLIDLEIEFLDKVYVVAVDDGSVRAGLSREFWKSNLNGLIIKLKRNVGHQQAIFVGINWTAKFIGRKQIAVIMDGDGEDSPASIKILIHALNQPDIDVAVASRAKRSEPLKFKFFYNFYKFLFKILTGKKINFGNFMAMKQASLNRIAAMHESSIHLAASVLISNLNLHYSKINRGNRYAGKSKMNFSFLVLHGFRGLMVFFESILIRLAIFCGLIASFSILTTFVILALKFLNYTPPGWSSIAIGIIMVVLIQTIMLSLISLMMVGIIKSFTPSPNLDMKSLIEYTIEINKN
jgi:polyisoprenyl-phosphate glycosyltransferase